MNINSWIAQVAAASHRARAIAVTRRVGRRHSAAGPSKQETTMNEITTTTASDRSRGRLSRRLRPLVVGAAAVVLGTGAAVGLFASAANADVNGQFPTWSTTTWKDCRIWAGDKASPELYAIGDTTVLCNSYHNIAVHTRLYRNGLLIATSANPYS